MKTTIATLFVALFLAVPVFSQNRERHMDNRGVSEHRQEWLQERARNRERESRDRPVRVVPVVPVRPVQPRIEDRRGEQHRDWDRRERHERPSGPRVVIVPRLTFRFPFFYKGARIYNAYDYGFRDGFYKGREDFRFGFPCDPEFEFDYRHSYDDRYRAGFLAGYDRGCRWR